MSNRNPSLPRNADRPIKKAMTSFVGMLSGEPASQLPDGYSAHNYNVIDCGGYYKVRNGSRLFTSFKFGFQISSVAIATDQITLVSVHQWVTGDIVYFKGDALPTPFVVDTAYYVIKISSKIIQLATTYVNAIAGTAINITAVNTDTAWVYYGEINAVYDHIGLSKVVFMLGKSVYVANKKLNVYSRVLNLHGTDPDGISVMWAYDNDVFLLSATGGIFRIVLDDDFYWMDKVNKALPSTLITDINETVSLIYGYLYVYSMALLAGTGNRDRLSNEIEFESGTIQGANLNKDYGERFYQYEIGLNLAQNHNVGVLTLPADANNITHFPLYRSRQIGENSGGAGTTIDSIGNRRDFLLWVADVPVAKAFIVNTSGTPGTAIIVSGNKFVYGDATSVLKDSAGNTATISAYTDADHVTVGSGLASGTAVSCAIGGGRVMTCSQSGTTVTRSAGDTFTTADKGLTLFVSDGTNRHVVKYLSANTAQVAETGDFTSLAVTLKPTSGNFSRNWNDTVSDDPQGNGRVAWKDLALYGSEIYIPRRFFLPVANCDTGFIDNGFLLCAKRGEPKYYYSQIGDKDYCLGYYSNPAQTRKVAGAIQHISLFPSKAIILTDTSTIELALGSSSNVGRTEVGETISELPQPNTIDPKRGVKTWQSIVHKNANLILALCSDSSYRPFDGVKWGEDLAVPGGRDAVSKMYLKMADQSYGITSFYSNFAGAKLWFRKWDDLENITGNTYKAVQLTWNDTDTNKQLSFNDYSVRGSGFADVQLIVL